MTPTLSGRLQTRLVLMLLVGLPVTLLLVPLLPGAAAADRCAAALAVLAVATVLGLVWEALYQLPHLVVAGWRVPPLLGLAACLHEGLAVRAVLRSGLLPAGPPPVSAFWIQIAVVWLALWLVAQGPLAVLFPRRRFRGGRLG